MKLSYITSSGLIGGLLMSLLGGWDYFLQTLLLFMFIDWFTGGVLLPGVFKKSPKSPRGGLESLAGFKGLCRKAMVLFCIVIANRLDVIAGSHYIRDGVCIGFIINEAVSIIENAGLMGVPIPEKMREGIDVLKGK